jgi:hypothetical protein
MQPDKAKMQHNAEIINKDDFYIDNADWIKVYLHYCWCLPLLRFTDSDYPFGIFKVQTLLLH